MRRHLAQRPGGGAAQLARTLEELRGHEDHAVVGEGGRGPDHPQQQRGAPQVLANQG